ncbi:MAG: 50S ribosomal protein L25 [Bacteroidales bacterium]|nr:50S ribosomal protein L25 [Bacteroidales bacterium]
MKSVSISGSLRTNVGKKDAKIQRKQGLIPCVMYGGGEQKSILVEEKALDKLFNSPEVRYVELTIEDKTYDAIVQEAQFHPVTGRFLHVDFLEVMDDKPIVIEIPMLLEGNSPGVLQGGRLSKKVRKIKVKGLLKHVPECIKVDISGLNISDSVEVSEIKVDDIEILEDPSKVLVSVLTARTVEISEEETEEGEEGAEEGEETEEKTEN